MDEMHLRRVLTASTAAVICRVIPLTHARHILLVVAALVGLCAGMVGQSTSAFAQCTASTNTLTCNASATGDQQNTDGNIGVTSARQQAYNANTIGLVNGPVTGSGLEFSPTLAGANVTVTNSGGITLSNSPVVTGNLGALEIDGSGAGNGGLVTYSGTGNVISNVNGISGLFISNTGIGGVEAGTTASGGTISGATFTGVNAISTTTVNGNNNIVINGGTLTPQAGGDGIDASSSGLGLINITTTGNTAIAASGGNVTGIFASTAVGNITISSDANIGATGNPVSAGLDAVSVSNTGLVQVSQTGGTIFANNNGITAFSLLGTGGVAINTSASSKITMSGGTGVFGEVTGAAGGITATLNGTIDQANFGGIYVINNAANGNNIVVHQSGNLTNANTSGIIANTNGTGNILVDGGGSVTSTSTNAANFANGDNYGIFAVQSGSTGNVTINGTGTTQGNIAIGAYVGASGSRALGNLSTAGGIGGADVTVKRSGAVTVVGNNGIGIDAQVLAGSSSVLVNGVGGITATTTGSVGINAITAGNGNATVNGTGAINSDSTGINVISQGSGVVTVSNTGAITSANGTGINAASSGGNVSISPGSTVSGAAGISASTNATGTMLVNTTAGLVTATAGQGILATSASGLNTVNAGAVNATTDGIKATTSAGGGVTITAGGNVVGGAGAGNTGITAIQAGGNGNVSVTPSGSVQAGNGINASAAGNGTVTVTTATGAAGNVTGQSGAGITASGVNGAITVTLDNFGTANAQTIQGTTFGVNASSSGTGVVRVQGPALVTTANAPGATAAVQVTGSGLGPVGGTDGLIVTGIGNTFSGTGEGIGAQITNAANASNILVNRSGLVDGGTNGINATTAGTGNVTVTGIGNVGSLVAGTGTGIIASNTNATTSGNVSVTPSGTVSDATGINANVTAGNGTVTVTTVTGAAGNVTGTNGAGIIATGANGAVNVTANSATVSGTTFGVDASANGTAPVKVTGAAAISGTNSAGIRARQTGAAGATGTGVWVTGTGTTVSANAEGIVASIAAGNASNILIDRAGLISGGTNGIDAVNSGTGGVTVTPPSNVSAGGAAGNTGIIANTASGNVLVTPGGTVTGANGIDANVATLGGTTTVTTATGAAGAINASNGFGIRATGANGAVTVNALAAVTANNANANSNGIIANTSGTGNVSVTTAANVGASLSAITINSGAGAQISNSATLQGAGSVAAPTINVVTAGAATTACAVGSAVACIDNTGIIRSNANLPSDLIVNATGGATNLDNLATGVMTGRISVTASNDTVNNAGLWTLTNNGPAFAAAFGGGADSLNNFGMINAFATTTFDSIESVANSGTINAGATATDVTTFQTASIQSVTNIGTMNVQGALNFIGNATSAFNNSGGLIEMRTGAHVLTDVTTLNATTTGTSDLNYTYTFGNAYNYNASGNAQLGLDAFLGAPGSAADRLVISGATSGTTSILLKDTNALPGQFNPTGITLVAVNGTTATNFTLSPTDKNYVSLGPMGAIDKGLFFYPLIQAPGVPGSGVATRYALFGLPNFEAFDITYAASGAQSAFYETALTWLDRQDELRNYLVRGVSRTGCQTDDRSSGAPADPVCSQAGGVGAWFKGIGSWGTQKASQATGAGGTVISFDTSYKQNTYGFIGGLDFGQESVLHRSDAFVLGLMGGYTSSTLTFNNATTAAPHANEFTYTGGTAGLAASYMIAGWFFDGVIKADIFNLGLNMPSLNNFGATGPTTKGATYGAVGDAGYRFDRGSVFLEPRLSLAYARTTIDNFSTVGNSVSFFGGENFRGALGARLGATLVDTPDYAVEAAFNGRYWEQINSANGIVLTSAGSPNLTLTENIKSGGFSELGAYLDITNKGIGWSGFLNGSAKFNNEFATLTAKGGVRYQW